MELNTNRHSFDKNSTKSKNRCYKRIVKLFSLIFIILFLCLMNFYITNSINNYVEITQSNTDLLIKTYDYNNNNNNNNNNNINNELKSNLLQNFNQNSLLFKKILKKSIPDINYDSCNNLNYENDIYSNLCDLVITIKTTKTNHKNKLKAIIDTWFQLVSSKTFIISDEADEEISKLTNNHLVETNCGKTHERESLSCKLQFELEEFLKHPAKWYCHVDDDNYLNIKRLYEVLKTHDPSLDWYLGKKSITGQLSSYYKQQTHFYSFATGGAGFCISHSLLKKLESYIKNFANISNIIGFPDDCTLGFIIESLIGVKLTQNEFFRSHLEYLGIFTSDNIKDQISLSYNFQMNNLVNVHTNYSIDEDSTKFKSIHCLLYSNNKNC